MSQAKSKQPDEIVAERIILELGKVKILSARNLNLLREKFANGTLSQDDAESLFEFDRPEGGTK
jgi:hypothetical protein